VPAQRRVDRAEDRLGHPQAGDHAGLLLVDPRTGDGVSGHDRGRGDVTGADILRQRVVDQLLHERGD
jgi:hypothetical protein